MAHQHYERQQHIFGAHALQYRQGTAVATGKPPPPPTWSPELAIGREYQYSLSECERDVACWEAATEVAVERQGPLLSLAVGGREKAVADQLPIALLKNGSNADLQDGQGHTELLIAALKRKFLENAEVEMIKAGLEFLSFKPRQGKTLESLLLRFETMLERANKAPGSFLEFPSLDSHVRTEVASKMLVRSSRTVRA